MSKLTAYFKKRNLNINCIVVDWGAGANTINYIAARRRVKPVGLQVGKFIDFLVIDGGMKLTDLMIIGHSLGAHVGGFGMITINLLNPLDRLFITFILQRVKT